MTLEVREDFFSPNNLGDNTQSKDDLLLMIMWPAASFKNKMS